jgi:geranylgeranyl reductase family protein
MSKLFDVAVVGAGPGGSAAAFRLAQAGLQVAMLDKASFPRDKTCGDGLSPRALAVLEEMGVLPEVQAVSHRVDDLTIISPRGVPIAAQIPQVGELPAYGLVAPRLVLDDVVRRRAVEAGVHFLEDFHVSSVERDDGRLELSGRQNGRPARCLAQLVILATGASFSLLRRVGLIREEPDHMVAARAYFEGISDMPDRFNFYFEGIPLPGYGWLFPMSGTSANVGAGFLRTPNSRQPKPATAREAFDDFCRHPRISRILRGAQRVGPVKGFPLLVGFPAMPTHADGMLVIGEAAGLVNPLTGEGVDTALESGLMAARHLETMFAAGDLSSRRLAEYERLLRRRFQAQFRICERIRDAFMRPRILDWIVRLGNSRPRFKVTLIKVALGLEDVPPGAGMRWLLRSALASSPVSGQLP